MTLAILEQCSLVGKTLHCKGRGFESRPSNMPVIFVSQDSESTEYTVLKHYGVWVKTKNYILYRQYVKKIK